MASHEQAQSCNTNTSDHVSPMPFCPRRYQTQVCEVAVKRNTIAVLETGSGKTMIAVMLINQMGRLIKSTSADQKLIVFLAPTVHLVNQQFKVIKDHTDFDVEEYYGGKGVDEWNVEQWRKEINEHNVFVMTPQVLLDALRRAFISLEAVGLLVIDECHRAVGNHPYTKIMKEFYRKCSSKPKFFGMMASPIVGKDVASNTKFQCQISELEGTLDSQVYIVEDKSEMEFYVSSVKETHKFYDPSRHSFLDLKAKIEALWMKFDASLSKSQEMDDMDDRITALRKRLSNDHANILYCLNDLGLVCAYEVVKICLERPSNAEECEVLRECSMQCKCYLDEVSSLLGESLKLGYEDIFYSEFDHFKAVDLGYVSPKLIGLIELFRSFGVALEVLCLIFVDRIITAKVIERFVKKITSLAYLTVSYLTGSNMSFDALAPKLQEGTLESFRSGKVNLLFTTDVVEEGIHVPNCSYVILFDLPKSVPSYVQSRGRAQQDDSQFIIMLERGNSKQRDQLFDIIRSEQSMIDATATRGPKACVLKECDSEVKSSYTVDATGASVTADSSVSLVHRYSEQLPIDKYISPKPTFQYSYIGDRSYECRITLPPNGAFQTLVGPVSKNSHSSKQLACLEACKKLHQMGALDDHLLPSSEDHPDKNVSAKSKEAVFGGGTTRRKELHGTTSIHALLGTWGDKVDANFQAYKFEFSCSNVSEIFSGFVLLIESKLDDDVGNLELDLFLVSKTVKASISYCGQMHLDEEQMKKAKCFQEFFFNGVYGKLFLGSKTNKTERKFLLQNDNKTLWSPSYMYFLVPLEISTDSSDKFLSINWRGVNSCVSVVEMVNKNSWLHTQYCNGDTGKVSPFKTNASDSDIMGENIINFASGPADVSSLKETVVLAVHSGKIYSIVEVVSNKSADSPFEVGNDDMVSSEFASYREYFSKKYGIDLLYPSQPLLRLKQSHNAHNLLVDFKDEGVGKVSKTGQSKPQTHVHMPPELLVCLDVPRSVVKSLYLLPSVMNRLESLMLASQLRQEIGCHSSNFHIPSSLILEAISSLRSCESFSMERLELLGDSVLKYVTSCHLFIKYPEKHEGQLSALRSSIVSNANLHKLGTDRKLQGYIRDGAFDPRRWVAPGQRSLRPVPCKCGLDTLEVPLDSKFQTENPKVVVGKSCDKGHRWMGSKTIADCVEALIGAYYVGGGLVAAIHVMKWLGVDAELEPSLVVEAISIASLRTYTPIPDDVVETLESKLGFEFSTKGLLQEAITHAADHECGLGYCYQRLEFLGDSVLDLLITQYLYTTYIEIDPGELTDLRSASVSNENFAQAAVRRGLQPHLQHCSSLLLTQITEYAKSFSEPSNTSRSVQGAKGPKALGDMVESIAGAVLIDTKLNLDEVWRIFESILSPIVTPDKLELPPLRELNELCDSLGCFVKEKCTKKGETVHAELTLQLKDVLLTGEGYDRTKKAAKGEAAHRLLKDLETRGISYSWSSKKRKQGTSDAGYTSSIDMNVSLEEKDGSEEEPNSKKHKKVDCAEYGSTPATITGINTMKGGPRTTLFELCKKQQWPMPTFTTSETKSRNPIELGEGSERRTGFVSFVSSIALHIPNSCSIECTGDARADKKSSLDSAALAMLHELQRQGRLVICRP